MRIDNKLTSNKTNSGETAQESQTVSQIFHRWHQFCQIGKRKWTKQDLDWFTLWKIHLCKQNTSCCALSRVKPLSTGEILRMHLCKACTKSMQTRIGSRTLHEICTGGSIPTTILIWIKGLIFPQRCSVSWKPITQLRYGCYCTDTSSFSRITIRQLVGNW